MSGVTDPSEAYFKDGVWGFHSGVWQKLAMVWGFSAQYVEKVSEAGVAAGNVTLSFVEVPPGVVRVVLGVAAYNDTTVVARTTMSVVQDGDTFILRITIAPVAMETALLERPMTCVAGDEVKVTFVTCVAGDNVYAYAWGYDMDLS